MPTKKICVTCSCEFTVPNNRSSTAKACSHKCRGVLIAKAYSDQRHKTNCQNCGKQIEVSKSRVDRGNGRFCSKQCQNESMLGKPFTSLSKDGDTRNHSDGYLLEHCKDHPFAVKGLVLQHRLIMERRMRKEVPHHPFLIEIDGEIYLDRKIHVHHKNEIKNDNRRENLVACTSSGHRDIHAGKISMQGEVWPETAIQREAETRKVICTCKRCNKTFEKNRFDVARGSGIYCSRSCYVKSRLPDGIIIPVLVERKCVSCNALFFTDRWRVIKGQGKYCSNPCRHKASKK